MYTTHLSRELRLVMASPASFVTPFIFYTIVLVVFPIVVDLPKRELQGVIGALFWFAMCLSFLTLMPRIFFEDIKNGIIDQIRINQRDLKQYILVKLVTVWLTVFAPVLVTLPVVGILYGLMAWQLAGLALAILTGGIVITVLGLLLMTLAIGLESEQALVAVLYLPLLVPVMILGALSLDNIAAKVSIELLLAACLVVAAVAVDLCAYVLRIMLYE